MMAYQTKQKNRKSVVYELYSPMTLSERKSGN